MINYNMPDPADEEENDGPATPEDPKHPKPKKGK